MKYVFWLVIFFLGYRFWYMPKQLKSGSQVDIPQEPDNEEYADYEEVKE